MVDYLFSAVAPILSDLAVLSVFVTGKTNHPLPGLASRHELVVGSDTTSKLHTTSVIELVLSSNLSNNTSVITRKP